MLKKENMFTERGNYWDMTGMVQAISALREKKNIYFLKDSKEFRVARDSLFIHANMNDFNPTVDAASTSLMHMPVFSKEL